MKFVKDEIEMANDTVTEALEKEKKQDQLGIEETKQVSYYPENSVGTDEEPKPKTNVNKKDMVTMTLVNLRKAASKTAEVIGTIKGGETVSADSISSNGYTKVKYKNKEGYIAHKYLR